jgi:hypothetical protein
MIQYLLPAQAFQPLQSARHVGNGTPISGDEPWSGQTDGLRQAAPFLFDSGGGLLDTGLPGWVFSILHEGLNGLFKDFTLLTEKHVFDLSASQVPS